MKWSVEFDPRAAKEFGKLQRETQSAIAKALDRLVAELEADAPAPTNVKKLKGGDPEWRLRVGDYRVRFVRESIEGEEGPEGVIVVSFVRHRREAYRD